MTTKRTGRRLAMAGALTALLVAVAGAVVLAPAAHAASPTATFVKVNDWGTGYIGQYTVTNGGSATVASWKVEFDLPAGTSVGSYWDALMTRSGNHYVFTNREYNGNLAPGASATFGFVGSGGGSPTGCTLNGSACGGGPTDPSPTPSPTSSPAPDPSPGVGPTLAPYVDMGAWPTPVLSDMVAASGIRSYTAAFITSYGCKASWFGAYDAKSGWGKDQFDGIRAGGGKVKFSFGGASGIELAQACGSAASTAAEYNTVVTTYNASYLDFDIEGGGIGDTAVVNRRSQAIASVQRAHPGLKVSLTLPVLPEGLTADGMNVVRSAINAGVTVDMVNGMAMDYYRGNIDMGAAAMQVGRSLHSQLRSLYPAKTDAQLWAMVGITPMLGVNDDNSTFTLDNARSLVRFAQQNNVGMLSFWEMTRDRNACTGPLYRCTNIPQRPYDFSKIFSSR
jgi:hypothetical protein